MKRAVLFSLGALCLLGTLGALGETPPQRQNRFANPLLDDVVQMAQAEVPDATILAYLRVRRARLETDVSAQDLIELHRQGVSDGIVEYIADQSGVEAPPAERQPEASAPARERPDAPEAEESSPQEPDPGDTGLIMGVYDPLPIGGYPCWPAWLAPYECDGRPIRVGGSGFRGGRSTGRDRTVEGKNDRGTDRDDPAGNRSSDQSGDRGDGRRGDRGDGGRGSSDRHSGGASSGSRSSGGGHGRH